MEKYINTKVPGIVLRVTWLSPHSPYTPHRNHPDVREERAGRNGRHGEEILTRDNSHG